MREMLACQATNDQDPNIALSVVLNKQLIEAKSGNEDVFVADMFRATAFLVTSRGTFSKFLLKGSKGGCFSPEDESLLVNIQLMMAYIRLKSLVIFIIVFQPLIVTFFITFVGRQQMCLATSPCLQLSLAGSGSWELDKTSSCK